MRNKRAREWFDSLYREYEPSNTALRIQAALMMSGETPDETLATSSGKKGIRSTRKSAVDPYPRGASAINKPNTRAHVTSVVDRNAASHATNRLVTSRVSKNAGATNRIATPRVSRNAAATSGPAPETMPQNATPETTPTASTKSPAGMDLDFQPAPIQQQFDGGMAIDPVSTFAALYHPLNK